MLARLIANPRNAASLVIRSSTLSVSAATSNSSSSLSHLLLPTCSYSSTAGRLSPEMHGTTILCVKKDGKICMIGDGQVSLGSMVVKGNAKKVRRLRPTVLTGFAGSTADAFTLLERLDAKVDEFPNQGITRPCVELAKAWRSDKYLRRLEAVLLVADDKGSMYELTGNGDVLEATGGVMGVGSGGSYALAAARALMKVHGMDESNCKASVKAEDSANGKGSINMSAEEIARMAMAIASDMCVYTNRNYTVEIIDIIENKEAAATTPATAEGEKK